MTQKKLTDIELNDIKSLQQQFQNKVIELGQLYLEKMQIEDLIKNTTTKENKLQEEWKSLQKSETDLIDKLIKTYGEGQLNLKDGTFVSDNI